MSPDLTKHPHCGLSNTGTTAFQNTAVKTEGKSACRTVSGLFKFLPGSDSHHFAYHI